MFGHNNGLLRHLNCSSTIFEMFASTQKSVYVHAEVKYKNLSFAGQEYFKSHTRSERTFLFDFIDSLIENINHRNIFEYRNNNIENDKRREKC